MAITVDATIATGGNKTSEAATTVTLPAVTMVVGDVVVIEIAADNAGTGGASSYSSTGAPSTGAWTTFYDDARNRTEGGAANDGTTKITVAAIVTSQITSASTVAINWSPNTAAKAWIVYVVHGADGSYVNADSSASGVGNGASIGGTGMLTGSLPTRAVQNGDLVIGGVAIESNGSVTTFDSDTTNGSWSSGNTSSSGGTGGDGTKMAVGAQYKIVTADGDQNWLVSWSANTTFAARLITIPPAVLSPAVFAGAWMESIDVQIAE